MKRKKIFDISVSISPDMISWPTDPGVTMNLSKAMVEGSSSNVSFLQMGSHTGTHLDAPYHFIPEGRAIEKIPLDVLVGPAKVFELDAVAEIGRAEVEELDLEKDSRVLFKTRNSHYWEEGRFREDFVYVSLEAAKYLVEKEIRLVGVDYLSIEKYKSKLHPVHRFLLQENVVIVEGLDLSEVTPGEYELIALPLKIAGGDGAPARVILRL